MNTQTHLLLACAVLLPATSNGQGSRQLIPGWLVLIALVGALTPDASIFVMWGIAKIQAIPEAEIWRDWYYSPFWQSMGAITNSIPLFLLLLALGWIAGGRFANTPRAAADYHENNAAKCVKPFGTALVIFAGAALLHVLTDLPLHHDDGHPHLWPLSTWIYSSPVSYWDPAHYGRIWTIIEILIAAVLILVLWQRFRTIIVRAILMLAGLSYLIVSGYWIMAFS